MFTVPQYFQEVRGATPLGSGVRMLPLIGGLLFGMAAGGRLSAPRKRPAGSAVTALVSAKTANAAGFAVMAIGLAIGAFTGLGSATAFAALWIAVTGAGLGVAMPSAMDAAVRPLTGERSGSGSALISAVRQVGATIGVAILGTILSNGYTSQLRLADLPAPAASAVRSSVAGGVAVAEKLGSTVLLDHVRTAFIHGMDVMLWACAGIALASAMLALAFLPGRSGSAAGAAAAEQAPREPAGPPRG
jgi:DHA2 family multidrug resistance protein-like MFS transporter